MIINVKVVMATEYNKKQKELSNILIGIKYDQSLNKNTSIFAKFLKIPKQNHRLIKWNSKDQVRVVVYDNYSNQFDKTQDRNLIVKYFTQQISDLNKITGIEMEVKIIDTNKFGEIKRINSVKEYPSIKIEFKSIDDNQEDLLMFSGYNKIQDIPNSHRGFLCENFVFYNKNYEIKKSVSFIYPSLILGVVPYPRLTDKDLEDNIYDSLLFLLGLRVDNFDLTDLGFTKKEVLNYLYNQNLKSGMDQTEVSRRVGEIH